MAFLQVVKLIPIQLVWLIDGCSAGFWVNYYPTWKWNMTGYYFAGCWVSLVSSITDWLLFSRSFSLSLSNLTNWFLFCRLLRWLLFYNTIMLVVKFVSNMTDKFLFWRCSVNYYGAWLFDCFSAGCWINLYPLWLIDYFSVGCWVNYYPTRVIYCFSAGC